MSPGFIDRGSEQQHGSTSVSEEERLAYRDAWWRGIAVWGAAFATVTFLAAFILPPLMGACLFVLLLFLGPFAIYLLRLGRYVPGERTKKWCRALFVYFGVMALLACIVDDEFRIGLFALLLTVGPIVLLVAQPRAAKRRRQ